MNDMGYVSDRLTGIMRVSDLVKQIKEKEMTPEERSQLLEAKTLEERSKMHPELSARATAIFNRAVAQIEEEDRLKEARTRIEEQESMKSETQTSDQLHPVARSFLVEAKSQGIPLSEKEATFLSSISGPEEGLENIPKELLKRLQKFGVANCTHHPDW